ncbi:MAG TPA: DUF2075 domain-containing protein [Terriglobales bacterium]|jgi:hypothetical protein|nr:DUF2075 domain-containing protein [Terriglobales bacterium]
MSASATYQLPRAWYSAPLDDFLAQSAEEVLGHLTRNSAFNIDTLQAGAWTSTILLLRRYLAGRKGHLLLEFNIPRMGSRADVVLLLSGCVVILELKVGEKAATTDALNQVWEYALDTKNFHEPSHALPIIPVLVPTMYQADTLPPRQFDADGVCRPLALSPTLLMKLFDDLAQSSYAPLNAATWIAGRYRPTPTIIEAARHLYASHNVADIVRTEADERNLSDTARRVESLIERARANGEKIIIFVTGVPGAGKTLVGLNIATSHRESSDTHAVFLSGNGPLVTVLREALTRDDIERRRKRKERITKKEAGKPIKAFIQNVHHFRDEGLRDAEKPPIDRIVIFDEAQRAWNRQKAESWMRTHKGIVDFQLSEPEFLVECMNRHTGWAAIVCLVGGGQEIGSGEAGIGSWVDACADRFRDWSLCVSDRLLDTEYGAGAPIERVRSLQRTQFFDDLHLTVSMRSFRAERVSSFVKALLDCEVEQATQNLASFHHRYAIKVTRDLEAAKRWIRSQARAHERYGLLASSKAMRLKPHAIDVRVEADPTQYFLGASDDVRSSYYLEDCATEFQVQGLELDWTVVTWDADLRRTDADWSYHDFRGSKWQNIKSAENKRNLKNAYRVLLTRARQGMVIFVPPGSPEDGTRHPSYYDRTYKYFVQLGLNEL